MAVSSNSERVNELRQLIHAQVTSEDTQARIKACLARANGGQRLDESSLLRLLEEEGVVEEVLSSLKIKGITSVTPVKAKPSHIERNGTVYPHRGVEYVCITVYLQLQSHH